MADETVLHTAAGHVKNILTWWQPIGIAVLSGGVLVEAIKFALGKVGL